MANERYDIEVTDKIDGDIPGKLRDIAKGATEGDSAVRKLKAALSDMNDTAVRRLATASANLTNTLGRELAATKAATGAAGTLASNKDRLAASSKAVTSAIRTETTAVNRLTAAYEAQAKAAAAAAAARGTGTPTGSPGAGAGGAGGASGAASAVVDLKGLADAARTAAAVLRTIRAPAAPSPGGGAGGGGSGAGGTGPNFARYGGAAQLADLGKGAGLAGYQVQNLGYQLNDVFVSLASGQKPLTVFIQQGAQIGQIYGQTGLTLGGFMRALTQMLGLTKTVTAAAEAAALAAARQAEANVAGANATATAAVRAAETNIAVAEAQVAMATTANEAALASNRLALAQAELGVANTEAAITANALASAQARTAEAGAAAAAKTRTGLTLLGAGGLAVSAILVGLAADTVRINEAANKQGGLKEYANSLGLTRKEMKQLAGETSSGTGKVKELKDITVTYMDTLKGLWVTIEETFDLSPTLKSAATAVKDWFNNLNENGDKSMASLYGTFVGGYRAIVKTWGLLPSALGDLFVQTVNISIEWIEKLVNKSIEAINYVSSKANTILPDSLQIPQIDPTSLGRMQNQFAGSAKQVGDTFKTETSNATNEALKGIKGFYKRWTDNSVKAAKDRIKRAADALKADRTPKKDKKEADPKTQADYINDTNSALDKELSRMSLLKDARAEQQRLDQIEEEFIKRRMPLDAAQIKVFSDKIHAIEIYKYQQAEMDRIVEESQGPQRTYNATIAAATDLLARHVITQAEFSQQQLKANRALAEAKDPLFSLKESMTSAEGATKLYGDAVARNDQYEQIRQAYLAKGIDITKNSTAAIQAEVQALLQRGDALRNQQFVQSQVGEVVNPILDEQKMIDNKAAMYAEIERLRQADVLSEEQAARARLNLNLKFDEMRNQSYSDLMGSIAGLASSHNKKLAAIGKAAAIAQATFDGYVAIQKALASSPPPFNYITAAAVGIKTAINIAGIASTNVGSYNDGGSFMVKGTPGIDKNNINMNVSRGERVSIETKAQQRSSGVTVNVHNYGEGTARTEETTNADGSKTIDVIVEKVKAQVAGDIRSGGTPINRAIESRYGTNPARGNG